MEGFFVPYVMLIIVRFFLLILFWKNRLIYGKNLIKKQNHMSPNMRRGGTKKTTSVEFSNLNFKPFSLFYTVILSMDPIRDSVILASR